MRGFDSKGGKLILDVSKNGGKTPKWMVKIMENPMKPMNKWDDLGGFPIIFEFNTLFVGGGNLHFSGSSRWIVLEGASHPHLRLVEGIGFLNRVKLSKNMCIIIYIIRESYI